MRSTFQAGKAFPALALAFAIASHAHAQGLGEITLESSLHEPLRAHIDLLDIGNLDSTQIKAALGTQTEFKVAGIERTAQLSALNFTVETRKGGVGRIVITSDGEINEPYLDFMLGVDWPKGRTLREYTLLLDLPENHAKSSTNAPAVSRESAVATAPPAPASASATPPASKPAAAQQYEVKTGDSLYQIAEQTRPSAQVGVQQMMIAIQRANEDAFVNNNVNRILTGKVLRIPRMEEITLIDQEAAVAQVNQQNAALNSETLAVNNAPNAPKAAPHDELTLLSGDQDAKVAGSNDLNATIKQLENQLMTSEEGLDRARLENLELTNRLAAVQEQIDLLQNIIAIEDERIAQMQSQLSKQSAATKEALAKAESSSAGKDGGSDSGLIGLLSNSVVLLGAALAAALGVAGMLFVRRRNAQAALAGDAEVELDSVADVASTDTGDSTGDEVPGGLRGMIASLFARFRRNKPVADDEDDGLDDNDQFTFSDEAVAATAAVEPPGPPVTAERSNTDKLLDEMGLSNEFKDLQSAFDEVDTTGSAVTETEIPAVEPQLPPTDTAIAEAGALMEEAKLLDQALEPTGPEPVQPEAFPQAEVPAEPAVPETFAFTTEPVAEVAVETAHVDEKPEVFEFTLPNLEDTAGDTVDESTAADKPETISFDTSALSLDDEVAVTGGTDSSDNGDALEVLSFDEDSIKPEDEGDTEDLGGDGTMDTHDARLDLAVAYEAMGDLDGAIEILDEVIGSGKATQIEEAKRLKQKWRNA